ncbi:MAG: hypothetical protein AAF573_18250 [Bacteroidota bacterium]
MIKIVGWRLKMVYTIKKIEGDITQKCSEQLAQDTVVPLVKPFVEQRRMKY